MGKISKGILGGVSGKVGNVVGSSWKGIDYLRVKPASVSQSNTLQQVTIRMKFALMMKLHQPIIEVVRIGFRGFAVKQSAYNAAVSYNYHNAIVGEYPDFSIDFQAVLISRGNLPGAVNPSAASTEAAKVVVTWEPNTGQGSALATDQAMVVLFNPELMEAVYITSGANRENGTHTLTVPSSWSGTAIHAYVAFLSNEAGTGQQGKNRVSSSVYAGTVTVV